MFSASLSLAAKDTPRTGKKYHGVFAVSRRGGDEKTDGRTKNACFLHRMPLMKTRRVHQEPLYGTARPFRTPGGPLRYRMLHRQKGERHCLRRIFQTARKEKVIAKSAVRNAAASKKITAKKFAMPPQSYSVPLGKASMPQSYSVPPESGSGGKTLCVE